MGRVLTEQLKFKLDNRCSNNQAEQLAIVKVLEVRVATRKQKQTQDSSHLHGQQDNTGLNKEHEKSQPPHRRNREESSNLEQKELGNRI